MNKLELVSAVSKKTGMSKTDVNKMLNAVIETITEELASDEEVKLIGFGKFSVSDVKPHLGRNPLDPTEVIKIEGSKRVYFSAGSKLKERINDKK